MQDNTKPLPEDVKDRAGPFSSGSAEYMISDIPRRVTNPIINDARFLQKELCQDGQSRQFLQISGADELDNIILS